MMYHQKQLPRWTCVGILLLLQCLRVLSHEEEIIHNNDEVNYAKEAMRVHDYLKNGMDRSSDVVDFIGIYGSIEADAFDRDSFSVLGESLLKAAYPQYHAIYYGFEDGSFYGSSWNEAEDEMPVSWYREPGESGYGIDTDSGHAEVSAMDKYYEACIGDSGEEIPCLLRSGDEYIECTNNCSLQRCDDEDSQRDCSTIEESEEKSSCEANLKWCKSYKIKQHDETQGDKGYIPESIHCVNQNGLASQSSGTIQQSFDVDSNRHPLGNCYHDDLVTEVDRHLSGGYAYCGGGSCNNTFVGAKRSINYDPRWRPWYTKTKQLQRPIFHTYPWFASKEIGTSYLMPIYTTDGDGNRVFHGVLGIDTFFSSMINEYLANNYPQNEGILVAIVETESPNYVKSSSTRSSNVKKVLKGDHTQPCPIDSISDNDDICEAMQIPIYEFSETHDDRALSKAHSNQAKAGFPMNDLVYVNVDGIAYASFTHLITDIDGLAWRILIMSPLQAESEDMIEIGDPALTLVLVPAILGAIICSTFFALLIKNRRERDVAYCDWRFTAAFIFSCILLNLACISFIGKNDNDLCMLRMWLLPVCAISALAPLLAKIYRMYLLVGGPGLMRRRTISHTQTFLIVLSIVLVQVIILLVFTFVDPRKQETEFLGDDMNASYRIVCKHKTNAFAIVQLIYWAFLILSGCVLSYMTRNMKEEFGESKQLILVMYNIAGVVLFIVLVSVLAIENLDALRIFVTVGVFWMTSFSTAVFVIPRLLRVREKRRGRNGDVNSNVVVTGVAIVP